MKKLVATKESLERAKETFKSYFGKASTGNGFCQALDALFVPEEEGWIMVNRDWVKGNYTFGLIETAHQHYWSLYVDSLKLGETSEIFQNDVLKAQAWADAEIKKYEKRNQVQCAYCGFSVPNKFVEEMIGFCSRQCFGAWHAAKRFKEANPKPTGPGTRLRAVNGDELLIVAYHKDWGIINLSKNKFGDSNYAEGWWNPANLELQLKAAGATVIEE